MNNLDCGKNVPGRPGKRTLPEGPRNPTDFPHPGEGAAVEKEMSHPDPLVESLEEVVDLAVEIRVFLTKSLDLPDRVDHRRVVLASEAAPDLGQRGVRQ